MSMGFAIPLPQKWINPCFHKALSCLALDPLHNQEGLVLQRPDEEEGGKGFCELYGIGHEHYPFPALLQPRAGVAFPLESTKRNLNIRGLINDLPWKAFQLPGKQLYVAKSCSRIFLAL